MNNLRALTSWRIWYEHCPTLIRRSHKIVSRMGNRREKSDVIDTIIEELKSAESLLELENETLQMIGRGENPNAVFEHICRTFDAQVPHAMSSLLVTYPGSNRLRHAAGVRVPRICCDVMNDRITDACVHSCGAATFLRERLPVGGVHAGPVSGGC